MTNRMRINLKWLTAAAAWIAIIIASGAGWNPLGVNWKFTNPGAFGDSFGPLSALMASLAALAAFSALHEQRQAAVAAEERDAAREKDEKIRAFETTFFNFLSYFEKIVSQTDIDRGTSKNLKTGKDSFAYILTQIENRIKHHGDSHSVAYSDYFNTYINDLAHYYRLLYNIFVYVDTSSIDNKYFYIKIVRSLMSDAELTLISLNCLYHEEGRKNLKPLVEKYSFLNNISEFSINKFLLKDNFLQTAFSPELR